MSPHTRHLIAVGLTCSVLLASFAGGADRVSAVSGVKRSCSGSNATLRQETLGRARTTVLCLINAERAARHLAALAVDSRLQVAAERHSQDMGTRDFFGHVTPNGTGAAERVRAAGFPNAGANLAENIAWGAGPYGRPVRVVKGWMSSPPHRATILEPAMRRVGIGIALDAPQPAVSDAATYTADFVTGTSGRARGARTSRARPRGDRGPRGGRPSS
jgi:uncharacterized protein YkwD